MKGHVALFPSWLWDITSKSVDQSQSGLFDSDCHRFFRRSVSENLVPFSYEKVSFSSKSLTYIPCIFPKSLVYDNGLVDRLHVPNLKVTIDDSKNQYSIKIVPIIYHLYDS